MFSTLNLISFKLKRLRKVDVPRGIFQSTEKKKKKHEGPDFGRQGKQKPSFLFFSKHDSSEYNQQQLVRPT